MLLLIGLGVGLVFLVQQSLNMSFDSQQAEQTAKRIMDYQIPGGAKGFMSMNFSGMEFAGVMSAKNPQSVMLVIGKMPLAQQGSDPKQIQEEFQKQLEKQSGKDFKTTSQRTVSKQLCGQNATVTISEGQSVAENQGSAVPTLTYSAMVAHNNEFRFVTLTTSGADAESSAESVFNSLKCK